MVLAKRSPFLRYRRKRELRGSIPVFKSKPKTNCYKLFSNSKIFRSLYSSSLCHTSSKIPDFNPSYQPTRVKAIKVRLWNQSGQPRERTRAGGVRPPGTESPGMYKGQIWARVPGFLYPKPMAVFYIMRVVCDPGDFGREVPAPRSCINTVM